MSLSRRAGVLTRAVLTLLPRAAPLQTFTRSHARFSSSSDDLSLDWNNEDLDIAALRSFAASTTAPNPAPPRTSSAVSPLHHTITASPVTATSTSMLPIEPELHGDERDTIYQLSSGMGAFGASVGVAIVRISGPQAYRALTALTMQQQQPPLSRFGTSSVA